MNLEYKLQNIVDNYLKYDSFYVDKDYRIILEPNLNKLDNYLLLTNNQFDELHGGNCYEYTSKISEELNYINCDHSSFFFAGFSNGELVTSYTFIIVNDVDSSYCIDCYNKKFGLRKFNNEKAALNYMIATLNTVDDYSIIKYEPSENYVPYNNVLEEWCLTVSKFNEYNFRD